MKNRHERRKDVVTIFIKRRNGDEYQAKIDAEDFYKVNGFKSWSVRTGRGGFYYVVAFKYRSTENVLLHRLVMDTPADQACVFLNRDTFDCRKSNLKHTQRGYAKQGARRGEAMRNIIARGKKFIVLFNRKAAKRKFGPFETVEEAQQARDAFLATLK